MANESLVGQVFEGRYAIEAELGAGGCGAVFRAVQKPIGRTVAVKVLHPELAEEPSEVVRFQREAKAIAALANPHAVKLIDFGVAEHGQLFMVMEFVAGESLRALMRRRGRLEPAQVVRILSQIAECLAEAHDRGITHRDLKPENVHLAAIGGRTDFVKVLDFGIARLADAAGVLTSLTRAGTTVGSPWYMAPEQATANKELIGPATDVYALGVLAYEMITGRLPFNASNVTSILIAHVQDSPAWPTIPGGVVPRPLAELIMQCLAKKPSARPASGAALLAALRALPVDASWEADDAAEPHDTEEVAPVAALDDDYIPTLPVPSIADRAAEERAAHPLDTGSLPTVVVDPVIAASAAASAPREARAPRPASGLLRHGDAQRPKAGRATTRLVWLGAVAVLAGIAVAVWFVVR